MTQRRQEGRVLASPREMKYRLRVREVSTLGLE